MEGASWYQNGRAVRPVEKKNDDDDDDKEAPIDIHMDMDTEMDDV